MDTNPPSRSSTPRAMWERLIGDLLERADPARRRWLQEHPQRPTVVAYLVQEADEHLAMIEDRTVPNIQFWASIPVEQRPAEVVAMLIESVEVWDHVTAAWPNPPTVSQEDPAPPLPSSIPPSAPTRRGWSPTD